MSQVKSAFAIAISERGVLIFINLLSYVVIARLVSPEDVGVFSVASAFVALLAIFRDFGSGYYIATTKVLTQDRINAAFTFSLLIGLLIFGILQLVAPFMGRYFGDDRIRDLVRLIAVNSLILPFSGCLMTLMRRNFLFGRVFWINLIGTTSGALFTIGLAFKGWGYLALALGLIANYLATVAAVYLFKPGFLKLGIGLVGWREVFSFGGKNSAIGFTQQASTSLLEMAVGKYLGFVEAGLLSRAMGVVNLFNRDFTEAIRSVAIHSFSKNVREGVGVENAHATYLINYSTFGVFYFVFVFCFPESAIYILSGKSWLDAAPYLQLFAVMGIATTVHQLLPAKSMSEGKIEILVKATVVGELTKLIIVGSALALSGSAFGYGYGWIIASMLVALVYWRFLGDRSPGSVTPLSGSVLKGMALACIANGLTYLIIYYVLDEFLSGSLMATGLVAGVIALVFFVLILYAGRHPMSAVLTDFFKKIVNQRRKSISS